MVVERTQSGQAIQAIEFDAPSFDSKPPTTTPVTANGLFPTHAREPWWYSQFNMMLCVFALLMAVALLVVWLIPEPNTNTVSRVADHSGLTQPSVVNKVSDDAPWNESQRQQARKQAQEILAEVLTLKKDLEAKQANVWAKLELDTALEFAEQGDEHYKTNDYPKALNAYSAARGALVRVDDLIPSVLRKRLMAGNDALNDGKTELAAALFKQALELDQNYIPALSGLERVLNFESALKFMQAGQLAERMFMQNDLEQNLQDAQLQYAKAMTADPASDLAKQGAQRVADALLDKRYRVAMSIGFNALFASRYEQAKKGFEAALALKSDDNMASLAYRQSLASDRQASLGSMLVSAKALEKKEAWSQALSTYQAVLQRDPNQVSAKIGVIRSAARHELNRSLARALQDPLSLSRASQRAMAETALNDALAIQRKGPVLASQIARLESVLNGLKSDLNVAFLSDGLTDIHLLKAGSNKIDLGRFKQKKVSLKPGRYVLSGSRLGYVDVRRELNLNVGSDDVINVVFKCETPITGVSSVSG